MKANRRKPDAAASEMSGGMTTSAQLDKAVKFRGKNSNKKYRDLIRENLEMKNAIRQLNVTTDNTAAENPETEKEKNQSEQLVLDAYRKLCKRKLSVEQEGTQFRKDLELLRKMYAALWETLQQRNIHLQTAAQALQAVQKNIAGKVVEQEKGFAEKKAKREEILAKAVRILSNEFPQGPLPAVKDPAQDKSFSGLKYSIPAKFSNRAKKRYEIYLVRRTPLFDREWYISHYPDARNYEDPAEHYVRQGWFLGYDPSPWFSTKAYRDTYPDILENPLIHFLCHGQKEGRIIQERRVQLSKTYLTESGLFDPEWYRKGHPEIGDRDPWIHFIMEGWKQNYDPSPDFSLETYSKLNPDIAGMNPLLHYLFFGYAEHRYFETAEQEELRIVKRSMLFDENWYVERYPDLKNTDMDPAFHYLNFGFREGRDPSAFFHSREYLELNPDLPKDQNPLLHFLRHGCFEGRQFMSSLPSMEQPEFIVAEKTGLFDEKYYMAHNRDLAGMPLRPIVHFMNHGWLEGREPSENFSVRDYNNFNPDLKAAKVQPLAHFIAAGILEGRRYAAQITEMDECQTYKQLTVVPKLYDPAQNEALPFSGKRTVAVHLHLYYTDMAKYFVRYLKMIPQEFDLYISLPLSDKTEYYQEYFKKELPNVNLVEVVHTPNRGRDIAPFIVTFGKKLMEYDFICHIHSKRSPHAGQQLAGWLDYLMDHLFGSTEQLKYIFSLLEQNDRIVFPPAYSQLDYDDSGWGRNYHLIQEYVSRNPVLKLKSLPRFIEFSHGSMLWARGSAMAGYLDLAVTYDDFPAEPINSDATLAHVLERLNLLKTASCGDNADMLFLKSDVDDYVKYQMLKEKLDKFNELLSGRSEASKKLVLVSHDSDKSGGPILALNIARTFKSMGFKLYIIILKRGELLKDFEECGTVKLVPLAEFNKFQASLPILHDAGYDKVLLNTVISGSLAPAFRDAGFHVVTLIHEMGYSVKEYKWEQFCHQVFQGSEKVVMPSTVVANTWKEIGLEVPVDKLIINPQGDYWNKKKKVPLDREEAHREICRELQIPETSKIVMSAAVIEKRKGIDAFVETAEEFLRKDPDVRFVWIGATPDKMAEIPGLLEKSAKLKNCVFTGFKKDLDKFMAGSQIFFLPSLADPFPAVTLLAASQGTPTVLCDGYTGSADFCRNFSGGLVKEYSAKNFSAEIERLLNDSTLYDTVRRETLEFSRKFHSMRQYLIDLMSYFPNGLKKVSCIVPNYQYEKYLPERLNSIIKQDYPIYDIVFLDDCSKDNSLDVAEKILSEQDIDYVILPNETNSGSVFRQWFKGIEAAKGDFIWIAEADDACSPEFLRKTVSGFDDPEVCLSYAQSCLMDSSGKVFNENFKTHTDSISAAKWSQNYISPMSFEINDGLAVKNTIPNASAIVIRKTATEKINKELLFNFKVAGDWVFYLELLKGGRVAFTPEILNYYRRHNVSVVNRNMTRNYQEIEMIHRYILENFKVSNATVLAMEKEFIHNYNGAKPDFTPTLDYRKYLTRKKIGVRLVFLTDDLEKSAFCNPETLESYAAEWDVKLCYCGKGNPKAELLEKLPSSVGFSRLQDVLGANHPDVKFLIVAAELSKDTLENELERLKLFLTGQDTLLILDKDSFFAAKPDVSYADGSLKEKLDGVLKNGPQEQKDRILYFAAPAKKEKTEENPADGKSDNLTKEV